MWARSGVSDASSQALVLEKVSISANSPSLSDETGQIATARDGLHIDMHGIDVWAELSSIIGLQGLVGRRY
jgi:hypothetical protein